MSDIILQDSDLAFFIVAFSPAVVVVRPGKLRASGPATITGEKICVDGDEKSVEVPGCMYMTPVYSIPGTGTLKIQALAGDQVAKKTNTGGKAVLLKGSQFTAVFEVQSPAKQPPPGPGAPIPDGTPKYNGKGFFSPRNRIFTGT